MYLTPADLLYFPGKVELAALAWPEDQASLPDLLAAMIREEDLDDWEDDEIAAATAALAMIQQACNSASAEADSYLAVRYTDLPITPTPLVLQDHCRSLARYRLYARQATEEVIRLRTEALAWLQAVAAGQVSLFPDNNAPFPSGIAYSRPDPVFTSETLGGF